VTKPRGRHNARHAVNGPLGAPVALAIPAVAGAIGWSTMRGPRSLRRAQIVAWATLLLALPLIMALTYLTVTPICFD
jgi:hypothetical protein